MISSWYLFKLLRSIEDLPSQLIILLGVWSSIQNFYCFVVYILFCLVLIICNISTPRPPFFGSEAKYSKVNVVCADQSD